MSIWGSLPVENDDSLDWLREFMGDPSWVFLNDAFDGILDMEVLDYLEVTECAEALMAASILVELFDENYSNLVLDQEVLGVMLNYVDRLAQGAKKNTIARAGKALQVVFDPDRSELYQLIHADPALAMAWSDNVKALMLSLRQIEQHV